MQPPRLSAAALTQVHPPSPVWASSEGKSDSVYRPGLAPYSAHEEERIVFDRELLGG